MINKKLGVLGHTNIVKLSVELVINQELKRLNKTQTTPEHLLMPEDFGLPSGLRSEEYVKLIMNDI